MPTYPVDLLWCANQRKGRANLWSFPPKIRRHLIRECEGKSVVHFFGGRATFGTRLDIDPLTRPDVLGDAFLPPFPRSSFDVVILDPPYSQDGSAFTMNAQMKMALFRAAAWVARERVIWFSTLWVSGGGALKPERGWVVRVGDQCYVRCLQYFRVVEPKLPPVRHFLRGPAMKYNRWLLPNEVLPFQDDVRPDAVRRFAEVNH